MKNRKRIHLFLSVAALKNIALPGYHFVLPLHVQWEKGLKSTPDMLAWALYELNFTWSLLVLICGVLLWRIVKKQQYTEPFAQKFIAGMGLYWLIHAIGLLVMPPPMPESLAGLRSVLLVFPFVVSALHFMPWQLIRREQKS